MKTIQIENVLKMCKNDIKNVLVLQVENFTPSFLKKLENFMEEERNKEEKVNKKFSMVAVSGESFVLKFISQFVFIIISLYITQGIELGDFFQLTIEYCNITNKFLLNDDFNELKKYTLEFFKKGETNVH